MICRLDQWSDVDGFFHWVNFRRGKKVLTSSMNEKFFIRFIFSPNQMTNQFGMTVELLSQLTGQTIKVTEEGKKTIIMLMKFR